MPKVKVKEIYMDDVHGMVFVLADGTEWSIKVFKQHPMDSTTITDLGWQEVKQDDKKND